MKTFNKAEITEKAIAIFKENPGPVLYATSDGQLFFNKNRRDLHAQSGKQKLGVYDIARADVEYQLKAAEPAKDENDYTVDEIKELVAETSDFAQLDKMLEEEKAGKSRKTAIAAIDERIAELKAAQDEPKKD